MQRVIVTLAQIIRRASFLHPFVLRLVAQAGRSDSWVLFGPAGFANQPRAHTCLGGWLKGTPRDELADYRDIVRRAGQISPERQNEIQVATYPPLGQWVWWHIQPEPQVV